MHSDKTHLNLKRFSIKIAGESGQGINSVGQMLLHAIKNYGHKVIGYREYPSIIHGGDAFYKIDISNNQLSSISKGTDIVIFTSRKAIHKYLYTIKPNGVFIHSQTYMNFTKEEKSFISKNKINEVFVDAYRIVEENKGQPVMVNMVFVGMLCKIIGLPIQYIESQLHDIFSGQSKKLKVLKPNLKCLQAGYNADEAKLNHNLLLSDYNAISSWEDTKILTGNDAIALGTIAAGVRFYVGYPMTPSTSIMKYLSQTYKETGIIVKQAEDEITAAQMALGAMFAGTRALTGTSGGGFDLMTESLSLAGMTEVPFVCVIAQRPGPATGLPTWTSNSDLNIALYSGHGEFSRCVLSVSDIESCYEQIQKAMNISENCQIPVLLLTDKYIGETEFNVNNLGSNIEIERGLVKDGTDNSIKSRNSIKRYKVTKTNISPRWIPGSSKIVYNSNSDEHLEDGTLTEDADTAAKMYEKRIKKLKEVKKLLNDPVVYGNMDAPISFVGWGSTKSVMKDVIEEGLPIKYLHFDDIYPLKTKRLKQFIFNSQTTVLIENNYTAQLGELIKLNTGIEFNKKYLKYDGRPFYNEDVVQYIQDLLK